MARTGGRFTTVGFGNKDHGMPIDPTIYKHDVNITDNILLNLAKTILPNAQTSVGDMMKVLKFIVNQQMNVMEGSPAIVDGETLVRFVQRLSASHPDTGMFMMEVGKIAADFLDVISDGHSEVLNGWSFDPTPGDSLKMDIARSNGTELHYQAANYGTQPPVNSIGYTWEEFNLTRWQAAAQINWIALRTIFGSREWTAKRAEASEAAAKAISHNVMRTLLGSPDFYTIGLERDLKANSMAAVMDKKRTYFGCITKGAPYFMAYAADLEEVLSRCRRDKYFNVCYVKRSHLNSLNLDPTGRQNMIYGKGSGLDQTKKITGMFGGVEFVGVRPMIDKDDVNIMSTDVVVPEFTVISRKGPYEQKIQIIDINNRTRHTLYYQDALYNTGAFDVAPHSQDMLDDVLMNGIQVVPEHYPGLVSGAVTAVGSETRVFAPPGFDAGMNREKESHIPRFLYVLTEEEQAAHAQEHQDILVQQRLTESYFNLDSLDKSDGPEYHTFQDLTEKGRRIFRHYANKDKTAARLAEYYGLSASTFIRCVIDACEVMGYSMASPSFQDELLKAARVYHRAHGTTDANGVNDSEIAPTLKPNYFRNFLNSMPLAVKVHASRIWNDYFYTKCAAMARNAVRLQERENSIIQAIGHIPDEGMRTVALLFAFLPLNYTVFSTLERMRLPTFIDIFIMRFPEFGMSHGVIVCRNDATARGFYKLPCYTEMDSQANGFKTGYYSFYAGFAIIDPKGCAKMSCIGFDSSNVGTGCNWVESTEYNDLNLTEDIIRTGDLIATIIPTGNDPLKDRIITTSDAWRQSMSEAVRSLEILGGILRNTPSALNSIHPGEDAPPEPDLQYCEADRMTTFEYVNGAFTLRCTNTGHIGELETEMLAAKMSGPFQKPYF